ncbi:MAG: tRNA1(Val) (adenine(37)-N6)-methyltransferase [Pseudomonadota bacterium]
MTDPDWTDNAFLGGRLHLRQPALGYRIAIDPLLLQAALEIGQGARVLDLGSGVGGAALPLAWRRADLHVTGLEREPPLAAAMRRNIETNGLDGRAAVVVGDAAAPPFRPRSFDAVLTNPPYLAPGRATPPKTALGRRARQETTLDLAAWLASAAALVRPGGQVLVVHRADRLGELAAAMERFGGGIEVLPVRPRAGRPARRVLVRTRVGRTRPSRLLAGLDLHGPDGHFTEGADRILRDGGALSWEQA